LLGRADQALKSIKKIDQILAAAHPNFVKHESERHATTKTSKASQYVHIPTRLMMKSFSIDASSYIVLGQALLVGASVVVGFVVSGGGVALALACGGLIAVLNTWLLARSVKRAFANISFIEAGGTLTLFSGLFVRLLLMSALFGLGFVVLKLDPLPFILGFVVAQVAYGFGGVSAFYKTTRQ
jgi:ATP synthase protein I